MSDLPGSAWLDTDGRHIWWRHECVDGQRDWMLPWPHWKSDGNCVTPSIVCTVQNCGFHSSPLVREPPPDFIQREATK